MTNGKMRHSMKSRLWIWNAFAAATLAVCACQTLDVDPVASQMKPFEGELTVRAAWGDGPSSKTVIRADGVSVWWTTKETLNLFYGAAYSGRFLSANPEPAASAEFVGVLSAVEGASATTEDQYWAVYPYNEANTCDGQSVTLTVPAIQTASAGTFADKLFPAVAVSSTLDMQFYHVCGGACFTVASEGIRSLTFKGRNGESLAGRVKVVMDGEQRPVVQQVLDVETRVTVYAPDGGTFVPGVRYYAVLIPQTLTSGVDIEYRTALTMGTCALDRQIMINRSRFGQVEDKDLGLTFGDLPIDRLVFQDANFADYVFDNFDLDADGVLSTEERNYVVDISVHPGNIGSLQGIEYFPNLTSLQVSGGSNPTTSQWETGQLTSLDLSHNAALEYLYCDNNQLGSLDLSHNPLLQNLSCTSNQLTSLDLSACPDLHYLSCGNNPLSSFDISAFTELVNLNCCNLSLNSLDISHLSQLQYLYCYGNPLGTLDVSNNPNLLDLDCSNCDLSEINLTGCSLLGFLNCGGNELVTLDISPCPNLYFLYAEVNPLTTLYIATGQTVQDMYLPDGVTQVEK